MAFAIRDLNLRQLLLDDRNPRLPEYLHGAEQADILEWMYEQGVLEELAVSFLDHGYLEHEPLFAMRAGDDDWVVLEGNRRLAALLILTRQPEALERELQFKLVDEPGPEASEALQTVPAYLVAGREDVRHFVGFRHIGGLQEWPPEAKARWIEQEIRRRDGGGNVFSDIARSVGTNAQSIRGPYLALRILRFAGDEFDEAGSGAVRHVQEHRFGVLVRATNSPDLRSYLAPRGPGTIRSLDDVETLVDTLDVERLSRVLHDMVPPPGRRMPVLSDSRDVTTYARALEHDVASKILEDYGDLQLARQVLDREQLPGRVRRLETAIRAILDEVQRDIEEPPSGSVEAAKGLLAAARSLVRQLDDRGLDD